MAISLKAIISKLNDTTRTALEGAAGLCLARTHYDVEIEHFLMKLLDTTDSDFARILKQFGELRPAQKYLSSRCYPQGTIPQSAVKMFLAGTLR